MNKTRICRVKDCHIISRPRRTLCTTHYHRWSKYKSFELPKNQLPHGILKICKIHGELREKDIYTCTPKRGKNKSESRCNFCRLNNIKKYHYEITMEEFNYLLKKQNNLCKICNLTETCIHSKTKKIRNLSVDHCHKSGKIRGLLCNKCNRILGYIDDSIEILESAIKYLKESMKPE